MYVEQIESIHSIVANIYKMFIVITILVVVRQIVVGCLYMYKSSSFKLFTPIDTIRVFTNAPNIHLRRHVGWLCYCGKRR